MIGRLWASAAGDYVAGCLTAVLVAAAVHAIVDPGWDLVLAMGVGAALGIAVHLAVLVVLGSLVGLFHVMVPGSLVGMYGGMLFGMRDSMQAAAWPQVIGVALMLGVAVVASCQVYDRALRSGSG